jgi:ribose-phosphate pyrophosphokinase
MENGATSVRAFCTHPVLSKDAYDNINNSVFSEIFVTDTIPLRQQNDKIKVLSCASLLSNVIRKVQNCESISSLFKF